MKMQVDLLDATAVGDARGIIGLNYS